MDSIPFLVFRYDLFGRLVVTPCFLNIGLQHVNTHLHSSRAGCSRSFASGYSVPLWLSLFNKVIPSRVSRQYIKVACLLHSHGFVSRTIPFPYSFGSRVGYYSSTHGTIRPTTFALTASRFDTFADYSLTTYFKDPLCNNQRPPYFDNWATFAKVCFLRDKKPNN